jgi:hypothetical protein
MPTAKKCKKSCMGFFDELAQKVMKGKEAQKSNYPRKAQAPYNKIHKNSVITEFKNSPIIGWVLVALDAQVRHSSESKP